MFVLTDYKPQKRTWNGNPMYTLFYVIMLYTIIGPIIAIVIIIVIIVVTIEVSYHLITLLIALPIDWYIILTDRANMFYL